MLARPDTPYVAGVNLNVPKACSQPKHSCTRVADYLTSTWEQVHDLQSDALARPGWRAISVPEAVAVARAVTLFLSGP